MSLYVREAGPVDAPTIVFLHGGGLSSAMWQPQLERLPDFHCLAPDLPEQGKSANIGPFTFADASRRVADVIRERVLNGRGHLVGLSIGGAVAVRLLRETPEVIDHAMISGTATRLNAVLAALVRVNEPFMRFMSPDQQANLMLRQFHIPQAYRSLVLEGVRACKPEVNTHFGQELAKIELPHEVQAPVLVAVGQKETLFAKRAARQLSQDIKGAKGVIVPGVGHAWNLEAPDLFTETVRAWVTDAPLPQELVTL
jgi:pimeloyl-ACP methyl ester carboxylesterase